MLLAIQFNLFFWFYVLLFECVIVGAYDVYYELTTSHARKIVK